LRIKGALAVSTPEFAMKGIAFAFFATGVVAVTIGMCWGIYMGMIEDHSLASAHAHLNLVGWVTLALFGTYYHLTPQAAASVVAKIHYGVAVVGMAILVVGIAMAISGGTPGIAIAGSMLTLASMVIFLITVLRHGLGAKA
jgi:dolichyl-phosphate-mannose--protein O-mannosyl transferase